MTQERLKYLFDRYTSRTCTPEEKQELAMLGLVPGNQRQIERLLEEFWQKTPLGETMPEDKGALILKNILNPTVAPREKPTSNVIKLYWKRMAIAVSIVLVVGMGYYSLFSKNRTGANNAKKETAAHDVKAPATNRAVITLTNGKTIYLDSAVNGILASQGNTKLKKLGDGQIAYTGSSNEMLYNTLFNPRGSKVVDMTLSDGSHIWLNAGSAVTYPAAFIGKERRVTVAGEVYISVAKNPAHPFIASVNGMDVQALGTEFNIEAYSDDEKVSTTLIEGAVSVSNNKGAVLLKPGEQIQLSGGNLTASREVNTDEVKGWKEGFFHFESTDLKTILRQFARWYDIEIVYEGTGTDRKFFGIVKRSNTLEKVLEMLQDNNIKFRIEGKKLFVKPG